MKIKSYRDKAIRYAYKKLGRQIKPERFIQHKDVIMLSEEEVLSVPPAIYHSKHLLRFLGSSAQLSLEYEYRCLFADINTHAPVMMLPFKKSIVFSGGAINVHNKLFPRVTAERDPTTDYNNTPKHLPKAVLVDNEMSAKYFGHWLSDEQTTALVATQDMPAIALSTPRYSNAPSYLSMLEQNIAYGFRGVVDDLNLLVDFSQGSHKQARYKILRKRLERRGFKNIDYDGVFIARGKTGVKRNLENEDALIEHLLKLNFDIIYPEKLDSEEIVKRLWNAPFVIGVEGSALTHALLPIAKHAGMLVLQPPYRICHFYKQILDAKQRPYGFYVCKPNDTNNFHIDSFDDLDILINQIQNASSQYIN